MADADARKSTALTQRDATLTGLFPLLHKAGLLVEVAPSKYEFTNEQLRLGDAHSPQSTAMVEAAQKLQAAAEAARSDERAARELGDMGVFSVRILQARLQALDPAPALRALADGAATLLAALAARPRGAAALVGLGAGFDTYAALAHCAMADASLRRGPVEPTAFAGLCGLAANDAATAARLAGDAPILAHAAWLLSATPGRFTPACKLVELACSLPVAPGVAGIAPTLAAGAVALLTASPGAAAVEGRCVKLLATLHARGLAVAAPAILANPRALPQIFDALDGDDESTRLAAATCLCLVSESPAGGDALQRVPRAVARLTAALRRRGSGREEATAAQAQACVALQQLAFHPGGERIAAALARAAVAEGSEGSLFSALEHLLAHGLKRSRSEAGAGADPTTWGVAQVASLLTRVLGAAANAAAQMNAFRRAASLVGSCARAFECCATGSVNRQLAYSSTGLYLILEPLLLPLPCDDEAPAEGLAARLAAKRAMLDAVPGLAATLLRDSPSTANARSRSEMTAFLEAPTQHDSSGAIQPKSGTGQRPSSLGPQQRSQSSDMPRSSGARSSEAGSTSQQSSDCGGSPGSRLPGDGATSTGAAAGQRTAPAVPAACGACGKTAAEMRLKRCAGCLTVRYCGPECARKDWRAHRDACKAAQAAAAAAGASGKT